MNTNSSSTKAVCVVAYLPILEVAEGYKDHKDFRQAKLHVLQTCIGKIVGFIEARSQNGFRCVINKQHMLLFPRIGAMSLDTIERVKYFGLRNVGSCGICRRRKGRSATRVATCHSPLDIENLYSSACAVVRSSHLRQRRKRARTKLLRHGLDPNKRCRLMDYAKHCLVNVNKFGLRILGGLCRYERLHAYFIAYCSYCIDLLIQCVDKRHYSYVNKVLQGCHQFRDTWTGATHPRLPFLLKMTHLTAERRVRAIFYWAHVLGLNADVII